MTRAYLTNYDMARLSAGRISKLRPMIVSVPLHKLMVRPVRLANVNRILAEMRA